jgi:hypothetical protein
VSKSSLSAQAIYDVLGIEGDSDSDGDGTEPG